MNSFPKTAYFKIFKSFRGIPNKIEFPNITKISFHFYVLLQYLLLNINGRQFTC